MSLSTSVDSDKYGLISIGAFSLYSYANCWQVHPESPQPTVIGDLESQLQALYNKNVYIEATSFATCQVERNEDDLNTPAFRAYTDTINNNTFWLWGNFYKGGVGFAYAPGRTALYTVTSYGKCYNPNTDKYIYGFYPIQGYGTILHSNATIFSKTLKWLSLGYLYSYSPATLSTEEKYNLSTAGFDMTRGNPIGLFRGTSTSQYADVYKMVGSISGIYPSYSYRYQTDGVLNTLNIDYGFLGYTYGVIQVDPLQVYKTVHLINEGFTGGYDAWFQELPPAPYILTDADIWGNGKVPKQPNTGGGTSGGGGGGGGFDNSTDNDDFTDPSNWTDSLDTGFISIYSPTKAQLKELASFLYSGITASAEILLKKLMANPMDYLVSLNMVHMNVPTVETDTVKFASISTGVVMNRVGHQFVSMYGGYFNIDEQFKTFLDYGKYSTIKISIPYCGVFPLPTDALMGGTLHINYIIDLLTGSMVAQLKIVRKRAHVNEADTSKVIATYTGNCFLPIPIASTDYRQAVNSLLGMTSGLATSVATGNPLPLIGASANAVVNSKQDINVGGNIGNNYGYMTSQEAFLILERPYQNLPLNYPYYNGYPSNIRCRSLNDVKSHALSVGESGVYIEIANENYWVGSVKNGFGTITETESKELENVMKGGVWL